MVDSGAAYNPAQWAGLFAEETSASAALTGLLFVAISIKLSRIVSMPVLIARSAKALSTLVGVLLAATFCLVPGQPRTLLGGELMLVGILIWIMITSSERASSRDNPYMRRGQRILHVILAQGSSLPMIVGGVSLILGVGGGLYWLVAGMIISFIAALLDAWVLLIEIHR
jgi:modulator of FtsH protease